MSEPETEYPSDRAIIASADTPVPPMPIKCTLCSVLLGERASRVAASITLRLEVWPEPLRKVKM